MHTSSKATTVIVLFLMNAYYSSTFISYIVKQRYHYHLQNSQRELE